MDRFEWLPTESAHQLYPMQIIKGDFVFSNGSFIYIPDGKVINNGWGEHGSTHLIDEAAKSLPQRLDLTWFSYTENTFYQGHFDLPYDKILALFTTGENDPLRNERIKFDTIIVGMAPEAMVSVWLAAGASVIEVAKFKGQKADVDWSELTKSKRRTREEYIQRRLKTVLQSEQLITLKKQGIAKEVSSTYYHQYQWKPEVIGPTPILMWARTLNGENEYFTFKVDSQRSYRSIPKTIDLTWQNSNGKQYIFYITFDEKEIIAAYKKLTIDRPDRELKLQIEISEFQYTADVFLRDEKFILKLEGCEVKAFKKN